MIFWGKNNNYNKNIWPNRILQKNLKKIFVIINSFNQLFCIFEILDSRIVKTKFWISRQEVYV